MNVFDKLVSMIRGWTARKPEIRIEIGKPVQPGGVHSLFFSDGEDYSIEVIWTRSRGFGLSAGSNLSFGEGVDEILSDPAAAFSRIVELYECRGPSAGDEVIGLADLRKAAGVLQADVALRMGITKSGLAQMERPGAIRTMKLETVDRLISSLGAELVVEVHFPGGKSRRLKVSDVKEFA